MFRWQNGLGVGGARKVEGGRGTSEVPGWRVVSFSTLRNLGRENTFANLSPLTFPRSACEDAPWPAGDAKVEFRSEVEFRNVNLEAAEIRKTKP